MASKTGTTATRNRTGWRRFVGVGRALGVLTTLVAALTSPAFAFGPCDPEWAGGLFPIPGASSTVRSSVVFDDGSGPALYLGGDFTGAGDVFADHVVKWDGTTWSALGSGTNASVNALAVFDDGSGPALYAGGTFTTAGGVPVGHVAKWNGSTWATVGSGVSGPSAFVDALEMHDDGSGPALYVGGNFTTAGGLPASRIAKWNGASWSALGSGLNSTVHALEVYDDGSGPALFAAGLFSSGTLERIAKWDGATWTMPGSGLNGEAFSLAVFDDGSGSALYVGGVFTLAGGSAATRIAKWNGSAWLPLGTGLNGTAFALTVFDDGGGAALCAGGNFSIAGGTSANRVAKWDGTAWSALGSGLGSGTTFTLAGFDDGSGPELVCGGSFLTAGGVNVQQIAQWNGSRWAPLDSGINEIVWALTVYDDGTGPALVAGGRFNWAGDDPAGRVAKWNGTTWSALGSSATNGDIEALAVYDDGSGPCLYAGGKFTAIGGVGASRIAKWNGTSWSALGFGVNSDVKDLEVYDDGSGPALYATGFFSTAGGAPANRIAKWNGSSWSTLGSGIIGGEALAVFDDGSGPALYVGGGFTTAGGVPANYVAKWNGSTWSALGSGLTPGGGSTVNALAVYDDGTGAELVVAGSFTAAGGVPVSNVAKWDGTTWSALGAGLNSWVYALSAFDDGGGSELYASGIFSSAGGSPALNVAKWDGTSWSALGNGLSAATDALHPYGSMLVAAHRSLLGTGYTAGTVVSPYLAAWTNGSLRIASHPGRRTVCAGDPTTFAVAAAGAAPFTYQWRKDGSPISGATSDSYTISAVAAGDAGDYDVVVTSSESCSVSSIPAALRVQLPPSIVTPPASQSVCEGGDVTFGVTATGTAPLAYQWRKDGAAISGATSSSFTIAPVATSDAGSYDVVVTNVCDSVTSAAAILTVDVAPSIVTHPVSQTVCEGDPVSFGVTAAGAAPLAYQWRKGGVAIGGATGTTFSIVSAASSDAGSYDVVVTNGCGSATSAAATLTVDVAPSIVTHPVSQTVCEGDPVSFGVAATGTAPLAYQWRKNGLAIGGATGTTFSIGSAATSDAGSYDVVVTNGCGSATSAAATLTVDVAPSIVTHPVSQTVCEDDPVAFTVAAAGTAPLAYQWRKNGLAIAGATGTALSIASALPSDAGSYDVVVTNGCGSATSAVATLTVDEAPAIVTHPASQSVCEGGSVTFTVAATGTAPLAYRWRKGGIDIAGATGTSLTIDPLSLADAGSYDAVVANACGSETSAAATLTVVPITLEGMTLSPSIAVGGVGSSTGRVVLGCEAAPGGTIVSLLSSDPLAANVPASVIVPEGLTEATFGVTTSAVPATTVATISATLGATTLMADLTVLDALHECLEGPGALGSYFFDVGNDVGILEMIDGETWRFELEDVDGRDLTGNREFVFAIEDHGTGSGGERLATRATLDAMGAGGHALESEDTDGSVRSAHAFAPGEVPGTFDLRIDLAFRCDGAWDVVPYFRIPGGGEWTPFGGGAYATASAFDLTQARVVVAIDAGAGGTLCFQRPAVATAGCRDGNVNGGAGEVADVLFVNGTVGDPLTRTIRLAPADPFELFMARPPSKPSGTSRFALYAWLGSPGPCNRRVLPFDLGTSCMPMPPSGPAETPRPKRRWNNIGKTNVLGVPNAPSSPAPSVVLRKNSGLGLSTTLFIQGIVMDAAAPNGAAGVTNGIRVVLE